MIDVLGNQFSTQEWMVLAHRSLYGTPKIVHTASSFGLAVLSYIDGNGGILYLGKMSCQSDIKSFQCAGLQITHPTMDTFMIKPLVPELTVDDVRYFFGIGMDRFLLSWLDMVSPPCT